VTAYIAIQQWRTNKNKLRLDLFDRRWAVFEAAMRMAAVAVHKPKVTSDDLREFEIASKGARFLFDQNLEDYCNKLRTEAIGIVFDTKSSTTCP
jgi:hypothetical protein